LEKSIPYPAVVHLLSGGFEASDGITVYVGANTGFDAKNTSPCNLGPKIFPGRNLAVYLIENGVSMTV